MLKCIIMYDKIKLFGWTSCLSIVFYQFPDCCIRNSAPTKSIMRFTWLVLRIWHESSEFQKYCYLFINTSYIYILPVIYQYVYFQIIFVDATLFFWNRRIHLVSWPIWIIITFSSQYDQGSNFIHRTREKVRMSQNSH